MAPRLWDPYSVLQIANRDVDDMFCVGRSRKGFNARCSWKIDHLEYLKVGSMLRSMAMQAPDAIPTKKLERLAQLSLCKAHHQDQQDEVVKEWRKRIESAARDYARLDNLKKGNMLLREGLELMRIELHRWYPLPWGMESSADKMINALKSRLDKYSEQEEEKLTLSNQLQKTTLNLQAQLDELQHQLFQQGQATEDLKEKKRLLLDRHTNTKKYLEQAQLDLSESNSENQDLQASNSSLQTRLDDLQTHINLAQDENRSLSAQLTSVSGALQSSQLEVADARKANADLSAIVAEMSDLRRHIIELGGQLSAGWLRMFQRQVVEAAKRISTWAATMTDAFGKWRRSRPEGLDEIENGYSEDGGSTGLLSH